MIFPINWKINLIFQINVIWYKTICVEILKQLSIENVQAAFVATRGGYILVK